MNSTPADYQSLLRDRLATLPPYPDGRFAGRGIVICAGGVSMFTNAWVLIHLLRRTLACKLPIELWHFGPDEISTGMVRILEPLDVRVVDATTMFDDHPAKIEDGWQLKPYALMQSSFAEALLLDADQVPVADPCGLFDWPEYARTGAVFWPDIIDLSPDNQIWRACGLSPERRPSFESGQALINKRRHWAALQVCVHFNEEAEHYYRMIYGDKDTFLAAWLATGRDFALVPHRPFVDARCLFQRDFEGSVIFQHRTGAKWTYAGEQRKISGFVHEEACVEALRELRAVWDGRIFHAPMRSPAAQEMESGILNSGPFVLLRAGEEDALMDFRPGHQLAEGRNHERHNWYVVDGAGKELLLEISDGRSVTLRFKKLSDDRWLGYEVGAPERAAELRLANDRQQPVRKATIRSAVEILHDSHSYLKP